MTRKQRIRSCNNLMQLMAMASTKQTKRIYRRQLETQLNRLRKSLKTPESQLGETLARLFWKWNRNRIRRWMEDRLDFYGNEVADKANDIYEFLFEEFYESFEVEDHGRKLCEHIDEDLQYLGPSTTYAYCQALQEQFEKLLDEVLEEWMERYGVAL